MREILFRGKVKDNGQWVYGNFVRGCVDDFAYIVEFGNKELCRNYVEVIPETVGQYTGLTDKNGKKIFEGDIHKFSDFFVVQFGMYIDCDTDIQGYGFYLRNLKTNYCYSFDATENEYINIVGNIHDNPELMKVGDGE